MGGKLDDDDATSPGAKEAETGRYTNVVCCEVKILYSEQNPSPSAAPNSFRGESTAL